MHDLLQYTIFICTQNNSGSVPYVLFCDDRGSFHLMNRPTFNPGECRHPRGMEIQPCLAKVSIVIVIVSVYIIYLFVCFCLSLFVVSDSDTRQSIMYLPRCYCSVSQGIGPTVYMGIVLFICRVGQRVNTVVVLINNPLITGNLVQYTACLLSDIIRVI